MPRIPLEQREANKRAVADLVRGIARGNDLRRVVEEQPAAPAQPQEKRRA